VTAPAVGRLADHGKEATMTVRIDEIGDQIYRLSTFAPEVGPTGFTFNQFLIRDEQPLLFHTGPRRGFGELADAVGTIMPIDQLRWIMFGHLESDECGAMNDLLAAAPQAEVAHGFTGVMVSLQDLADRPPVALADGQVTELGTHRVRHIDTPHVPHGWDAGVLYEETTGTLFCGDLLSQLGDGPAITADDIVGPAAEAEDMFASTSLTPQTGATIRQLADLAPTTLAIMHGSSFNGDAAAALRAAADDYDARVAAAEA
jgi:flavorubredoxin